MQIRSTVRASDGFSLIELMIVVFLMSLLAIGVSLFAKHFFYQYSVSRDAIAFHNAVATTNSMMISKRGEHDRCTKGSLAGVRFRKSGTYPLNIKSLKSIELDGGATIKLNEDGPFKVTKIDLVQLAPVSGATPPTAVGRFEISYQIDDITRKRNVWFESEVDPYGLIHVRCSQFDKVEEMCAKVGGLAKNDLDCQT